MGDSRRGWKCDVVLVAAEANDTRMRHIHVLSRFRLLCWNCSPSHSYPPFKNCHAFADMDQDCGVTLAFPFFPQTYWRTPAPIRKERGKPKRAAAGWWWRQLKSSGDLRYHGTTILLTFRFTSIYWGDGGFLKSTSGGGNGFCLLLFLKFGAQICQRRPFLLWSLTSTIPFLGRPTLLTRGSPLE